MASNNETNVIDDIAIGEGIEQTTQVQKCPNCGANLIWSPQRKCLLCEYCETEVQIDLTKYGEELNFANMLHKNETWSNDTHVYRCNNCGAKEVVLKTQISKICSFCGTTNVIEANELSGLQPNAIIPFQIDKKSACEKIKLWAKKKIFAPKKFKESVYPEEIHGNYSPVFTFDTSTTTWFNGVLGKYYYVEKKVGKQVIRERRTRYIPISGTYDKFFDDITIQASNTINQKTLDTLQPFDTNKCLSYSNEYLHGFTASQYSKDGEQCWTEARRLIESDVKDSILRQYTYDFVQSFSFNTSCAKMKFKYLLLPIYVGHCSWKQKLYNFYMNGRTGKITGKTPLSPIKVGLTTLAGLLLIGGAVLFYYLYSSGVI